MGDLTRGGRAEPSSRNQTLRRERGKELEDRNILCKKNTKRTKVLARKRTRRGRAGRRAARQQANNDRDQPLRKELIVATHNVQTMTIDGNHGVGRAAERYSACTRR